MNKQDEAIRDDARLLAESGEFWGEIDGKTILITGATGLIGSQLVRAILCRNELYDVGTHVVAWGHSERHIQRKLGEFQCRRDLTIQSGDIKDGVDTAGRLDYIVHGASVTASAAFVEKPVETIMTSVLGTDQLLKLAVKKKVKGLLYLSSTEVYGNTNEDILLTESYPGRLNPCQIRSSYPEGKRAAEALCAAYAKEYGVRAMVARLGVIFGPGFEPGDQRLLSQFAEQIGKKKNIVLYTSGATVRSYCYIRDAVSALLTILVHGQDGEAYNIANRQMTLSVRELADHMAEIGGVKVVQQCDKIRQDKYLPTVHVSLDTTKLESLGWNPTVSLDDALRRTCMIE